MTERQESPKQQKALGQPKRLGAQYSVLQPGKIKTMKLHPTEKGIILMHIHYFQELGWQALLTLKKEMGMTCYSQGKDKLALTMVYELYQ